MPLWPLTIFEIQSFFITRRKASNLGKAKKKAPEGKL
jgi:hypothetical protein